MAKNAFKRGIAEFKQERFRSAREFFQTAVQYDPEQPDHYTMLGLSLIESGGGFSLAEMNCEKAIALAPWNAKYHANLGKVYLQAHIKSQAKKKFDDALHWDPNNKDALEGLAALKEKKGPLWKRLLGR